MQRGVGLTLRQDMAYGPLQGAFTENEGGAAVGRTFGYARPGAESTGSAGSGLTLDGIKHTAEGLEYLADAAGAVIVKDGKWLGLGNLKYNSMTWGGNGATLGRGLALGVAENLEYFGKLAAGVGIGVSAYQTVKAYQSGDTIGAAVAFDNAVITAMCAATGPAGVVIGSLYLASEVTGLRPWASEWLGYRMTDFAEGWEQARTRTDPPVDNTPRVVSNDGGAAVSVMRPMGRRR
ncbi:MAG: hypothetical protein E6H75_08805 [Betaproteobacteria bacterium]|nr:MAG: hypothetical protein E6H75_08805 [Betaproteobacteria bacterium]